MKRDFLKQQGISDAVADAIMAEHGKDIEAQKEAVTKATADLTALQSQLDAANAQLTEAGKTIEGFKAMNVDQIKASADDYKAKFEQAQKDAADQVAALRFDHALERAVSGFNVHDVTDILHRVDRKTLTMKEDGSFTGLKEQMEALQSSASHLFKSADPDPKIVSPGQQPPTQTPQSSFVAKLREGAGLAPKQ